MQGRLHGSARKAITVSSERGRGEVAVISDEMEAGDYGDKRHSESHKGGGDRLFCDKVKTPGLLPMVDRDLLDHRGGAVKRPCSAPTDSTDMRT